MAMERMTTGLERWILRLSRVLAGVAAVVLAFMMFLMVTDVFCRYVLNRPILGAFEITEFMMMILVFFAIAHAQVKKAHISVDVLVLKFSKRTQQIFRAVGSLLGLGLFSLMTWQIVLHALRVYKAHQRSIDLGLPVFPFTLMAALGTAIFCLVLIVSTARSAAGKEE
jgi:TRAP-type transport system small permease protein